MKHGCYLGEDNITEINWPLLTTAEAAATKNLTQQLFGRESARRVGDWNRLFRGGSGSECHAS